MAMNTKQLAVIAKLVARGEAVSSHEGAAGNMDGEDMDAFSLRAVNACQRALGGRS
jgi:hypothetical protein